MASSTKQLELPPPGDEGNPLIYVASALTHLDEQGHLLIDAWSHIIRRGVTEDVRGSSQPWVCRIHLPVSWSPPESPGEPEQIYTMNSRIVREHADGLIVIGYLGGSLGAGQEFAWAVGLRMPILYVRPKDHLMSRQIEGTPADIRIVEFANSEELEDAARRFVRENRRILQDSYRRRQNRAAQFRPLGEALKAAWEGVGLGERQTVVGEGRLHERRIQELVGDPIALAGASLDEVAALSGALGLDIGRWLAAASLPDLDSRQLASLRTAATENDWNAEVALQLLQAARLELAKSGQRRLPLATPEDWAVFKASQGL